jgi:hypothetical protein
MKTLNPKVKKTTVGGLNFLITIHHTENNSWQGVLEWLDTRKKLHFRSALEMMSLINEAVLISQSEQDDSKLEQRHWQSEDMLQKEAK